MGDVGEIDTGGGRRVTPTTEVLMIGVVKRTVASLLHLGPTVVASGAQTPKLLFDTLGRQVAIPANVVRAVMRGDWLSR